MDAGHAGLNEVRHRIRAHRAALAAAESLGWPDMLADSVRETRVRLAEAEACAEAIETALSRLANNDASTYLQRKEQP